MVKMIKMYCMLLLVISVLITSAELIAETLSGTVTDASTSQPINGATVTIVELGQSRTTNSSGQYDFGNVANGTYTLRASATGYITQDIPLTLPNPPATPTGLTATGSDSRIDLNWNDNTELDLAGYNVYRSTTSGSGYTKQNTSVLTTSQYADTSGLINGVTYYYRVTAVDTSNNESGYATVNTYPRGSVQPTITVTYPNGGETWTVGETRTVQWTSQGSVGNVNIDLSTNSGSTWTTLVSNTANDGSQTITVPNTPSSTCRIRVQEPDGSPSDTSDNNFTISTTPPPPGITVIYPNGGETWTVGETRTVQWTSQGSVGNVNIDLSTNSGSTWTTLVSNTANDGSQTITVPNTPSSTCRIRVQEPDGSPSDISNSNFTIQSGGGPTEPIISVSTTVLDFGTVESGQSSELTFEITNKGGGILTGTIVTDQEWITVDQTSFSLGSNQTLIVIVTVDNSILKAIEGEYRGTITITSGSQQIKIDVIMTATCVLVRPNPYNPEKGLLTFFGSGIVPGQTTIKIYTLSGELVKELKNIPKNEITWNGKNEFGDNVLSGIYLYVYESPTEKGSGKFTVIQK